MAKTNQHDLGNKKGVRGNKATTDKQVVTHEQYIELKHLIDSVVKDLYAAIGSSAGDHGALTGLEDDDHALYGDITSTEQITGLWNFIGDGDGGLTDYDLTVGDVTTPDYGIIRMGNSIIGRTSHNVGDLDIDGSIIIRNVGSPSTSNIEFLFAESSNNIRFAIPKSGVGNATYNPRSMLIAGPAILDDEIVTVGYWQANEDIFDNLACDTSSDGADLGVQNDCEIEGDLFVDSIKESTTGVGITFSNEINIFDTSGELLNVLRNSNADGYGALIKLGVDNIYYKSAIMHLREDSMTNGKGHLYFAVDSNDDAADVDAINDVKMVLTSDGELLIDLIEELTTDVGVTIDGLLVKDGAIPASGVPDGADATAIHDNVADEISVIAEKTAVIQTDMLMIEDSEASNIKKMVQITNLPAGAPSAHKDEHDPEDGSDALDTALPGEISIVVAKSTGTAHSLARSDHGHQISHGIIDNHIVTIDSESITNGEYAKFTTLGLESKTFSELRGDINVIDGADVTGDNTCDTPGGAGTDTTAIHDNVLGEIFAIADKGVPLSADVLLIEDTEAANAKKKLTIENLEKMLDHDSLAGITAAEHYNWENSVGTIHIDNYIEGGPGTDTTAIHDNQQNEITAITLKGTPESADEIIIEDSDAVYIKKSATLGSVVSTLETSHSDVVIDGDFSSSGYCKTDGAGDYSVQSSPIPVTETDAKCTDANADQTSANTCDTPGGDGTDGTAIHDNTAAEIINVAAKNSPIGADVLLIEDTEAINVKKKITIANLEKMLSHDALADFAAGEHRIINDSGDSAVELFSSSKVNSLIAAISHSYVLGFSGTGSNVPAATTRYLGNGGGDVNTTEAYAEFYIPVAGIVKNLRVYVSTQNTADNCVVTLRKNGADQSVTVTYGSGVTGLQSDTSNSFSISSGERIAIQVIAGGESGAIVIESVSFEINY